MAFLPPQGPLRDLQGAACGNALPTPPGKADSDDAHIRSMQSRSKTGLTQTSLPSRGGLNFSGVRQHATHAGMPGQKFGFIDTACTERGAPGRPRLDENPVLSSFKMFNGARLEIHIRFTGLVLPSPLSRCLVERRVKPHIHISTNTQRRVRKPPGTLNPNQE